MLHYTCWQERRDGHFLKTQGEHRSMNPSIKHLAGELSNTAETMRQQKHLLSSLTVALISWLTHIYIELCMYNICM